MRILHVLPPASGGMLRHVQSLVEGLPPEFEQHCAAAAGPGQDALLPALGGRCLSLPLADGDGLRELLAAARAVARYGRSVRPDLIHGHGYRGMVVAAGAARLCRRPFVFTAHNLPAELGPRFWSLARPLCRSARGAACVSRAVAEELAGRLGPKVPLAVIYNGIAVGDCRLQIAGPSAGASDSSGGLGEAGPPAGNLQSAICNPPVVITAARFAPQKGLSFLLEAWAQVAVEFPDAVLLMVGDGPLRPGLQALAGALGLSGSVRFTGFRSDVRALLHGARAAAIPSLTEGQSIFAAEAMAEGVPVVATAVGGLPEMVRPGETGFLVPPRDPEALAEALLLLLRDRDLAGRLGAGGRAFAESELTVERMLERVQAFYRAAVKRG